MATAIKEQDMPFRVQTTKKVFVKGYTDEAQAKASAADRNKNAEKLGIVCRYEAVTHK